MRRTRIALLVALAVALLLAVVLVERPSPGARAVGATAPVARLRRGAEPVVGREIVAIPSAVPVPVPVPVAAGAGVQAAAVARSPRSQMTLDDLAPDLRAAVGNDALAHLHELVDACEARVGESQALGAFLVLDHAGILELDLRPIALAPGPIQVEDRELPPDLVDCLDDALWDQDWTAVGAAIPEGFELPAALTMRLEPPGEPVSDGAPALPTP